MASTTIRPSRTARDKSSTSGTTAATVTLDSAEIVDHGSPVPFYAQLSGYIEQKVRSYKWVAGQLLPSEQELCAIAGVSRTVVRQAINELERKGLVTKQSGKRSSIAFPIYQGSLMQNLSGFYEDAMATGQHPTTKVLGLRVIPATQEIGEALQIEEGSPVIELNRLRFLDGEPEVLVMTYLPQSMCPDLVNEELASQSLYRLLTQKYGLHITQGIRTMKAIALDRKSARLLGVRTGSPALLMKSRGQLADGRPLEYFIALHRGDRAQFEVKLVSA